MGFYFSGGNEANALLLTLIVLIIALVDAIGWICNKKPSLESQDCQRKNAPLTVSNPRIFFFHEGVPSIMDKKYRYTASYKKLYNSFCCLIAAGCMYGGVEAMWGGLGTFLQVDVLSGMALWANIPLGVLVGTMVVLTIVNYVNFKKKVADGSIEKEPAVSTMSGYVSGLTSGYVGIAGGMVSDAMLTPEEKKIKGLIQMYPKITLEELAAKAGVPGGQIEGMLLKLVSNGNVKGHIDPGTGEFISGMIDATRVTPVDDAVFDCPHCGAVMKSAPVRGTSVKCTSCGNLIVVK